MLNIGLDMDGVICEWIDIPKEERTKDSYDKLLPMGEATTAIKDLQRSNYITVVTARHYPGAWKHVYQWLWTKHKISCSLNLVVGIPTSSKWRVLQALDIDIYVDDNVRAFQRLPLNIIPILFRGPQNGDQFWEGKEVRSWPELIEKIKFLKERLNK